ncbi:MAG: dehydrogenase [Deltaproteobacteria bacterium]|jgi:2-oxoisovalerate dehydrogenase E1 component|nr:dehydrogenase [Deltaproteobacteria bacterium]MBT6433884.1 dehydrogenase [Deltaproteobacteria bacterium]MBT6491075.1 dehydrogenase [Deltaproteobacteria bacterium]
MSSVKSIKPVTEGLTDAERLSLFRTMLLSRRLDDVEIQLKRQNAVYFQISGAGHEATQTAAAMTMRSGHDWFFTYYRDRALCLGLGVTAEEMLFQSVGAAADPASGGRQMPSHWGHKDHNIVSSSSPTGTQFLNAVGCAEGFVKMRDLDLGETHGDEVVYVSSGEGTTSQGEFYEAMNTACQDKLPVIFHIQDNGYAISVPVEFQTAGGSISKLFRGYPNLLVLEFDGCDPEASYENWREAVAYARERKGPVLLHSHVTRPYSHSMSDDERLYRSKEEIAEQAAADPITVYRKQLVQDFGIDDNQLRTIEDEIEAIVTEAKESALAAEPPSPDTVMDYVYSHDADPTTDDFDTEDEADFTGDPRTMVDLINDCLHTEMERNPGIVIFGEDVADVSRDENIENVKGKGGVFKVTAGLQRKFGSNRVFNSPLAEANIIGRAVGMAVRGLKPVVEIQFFDYIYPAMMQIRSELALMRWRSNNNFDCPVVIRTTYGGYLKGGAVYHSQTGESIFTHIPGLRVCLPSNALDANGLLRTAIRCEDPVLFLEHKHLYRQTYNRAPNPGDDFMIPFGKAKRLREGKHLTLITYGALVKRSLDAVNQAAKMGIEVEVLDLRTISPYDWEAISESVAKTGKALVVYEDSLSWGSGSEIAARIGDELFDYLDGPVQRVASMDTFVGYHPGLEDAILPQVRDVLAGIEKLHSY